MTATEAPIQTADTSISPGREAGWKMATPTPSNPEIVDPPEPPPAKPDLRSLRFKPEVTSWSGFAIDHVNGWESQRVGANVNDVAQLSLAARDYLGIALKKMRTGESVFTADEMVVIQRHLDTAPRIDEIDNRIGLADSDENVARLEKARMLADRRMDVSQQSQRLRELEAEEAPRARAVTDLRHLRKQIIREHDEALLAAREVVRFAASRMMNGHIADARDRCDRACQNIVTSPDWRDATILAIAVELARNDEFNRDVSAVFEEVVANAMKFAPSATAPAVAP